MDKTFEKIQEYLTQLARIVVVSKFEVAINSCSETKRQIVRTRKSQNGREKIRPPPLPPGLRGCYEIGVALLVTLLTYSLIRYFQKGMLFFFSFPKIKLRYRNVLR